MSMERIFVTVRAKPLSPDDGKVSPWRISANSIALANQPSKFDFDRVFGEDSRTKEVYESRTKEIVASAVRGFNGTVFAYGQTSSGKTYTMRGSVGEPGIIPLAIDDLFQSIGEHTDREFLVRVSYMEIYNEEINDLLAPEHRKLQIHESVERGIFVAGLKEEIVTCPKQVLELMDFGESHRHIGETNMNLYSSRSHTIFRMIIESRERSDEGDCDSCDAIRVSILNLVDLAGSERVVKTGAEGTRLKEGSHINRSLLTLGSVIKKLSEGVQSQGGHVPYRDSKLTRILQPALGGNANTAIICNITLAQIHTDETKSTLHFASRALRVTNCAQVNEILTDAALLKRQKKEIEDLRARLHGSHSEHWEKEILNLRNTLLQSELEKERMALELEEEKKDKAQREKELQEKIANLSSMFLYSNRDGEAFSNQMKRRNTWCPGPVLDKPVNPGSTKDFSPVRESLEDENFKVDGTFQPLFEEILEEKFKQDIQNVACSQLENNQESTTSQDVFCYLDKRALMHVTNRRKTHRRNTSSPVRAEMTFFDAEEQFEIPSSIDGNSSLTQADSIIVCNNSGSNDAESEQILGFSQLCNQNRFFEIEKTSNQKDFNDTSENKQTRSVSEDFDQVWESLGMESEFQLTKNTICNVSCFMEDAIQEFFMLSKSFMEIKASSSVDLQQLKFIVQGRDQMYNCLLSEVNDLKMEKSLLLKNSVDDRKQIDDLKLELENCNRVLSVNVSEYEMQTDGLVRQIHDLQKEVTFLSSSSLQQQSLSSSSLSKENENLRKDLEKTRNKLKETDSKFRNAVQEKIRLEGEKAHHEREIKSLLGQRALLERDISRHQSLIGKKNDTRVCDLNRAKSNVETSEHVLQVECQRLELHIFELDSEITSLKEHYLAIAEEKEELFVRKRDLEVELQAEIEKVKAMQFALENLQEEVGETKLRCQKCESNCTELRGLVETLSREKEEMGMQLTDALLELEAEKSTRSFMEKDLAEITGKISLSEEKVATLMSDLAQERKGIEDYNNECQILREKLLLSEDQVEQEKQHSLFKSAEIDRLRSDMVELQTCSAKVEEVLKEKYETLLSDTCRLRADIDVLVRERDMLHIQCEKKAASVSSELEDALIQKENLKFRIRLRSTQAKLDMYRGRYKEVFRCMSLMNREYEEASSKLKEQLASYGIEILRLKKELQLGRGCKE